MEIHISQNADVKIRKADDFKNFKIVFKGVQADESQQIIEKALVDLGSLADESHAWIDAQKLIVQSGKGHDARWLEGFNEMTALGRKYGFVQDDPMRIRAHIEWTASEDSD